MLTIQIISLIIILLVALYIIVFFARYQEIPQSLSQTAEFPHQFYFWQVVICTTFGWLQFYYPVMYYPKYGLLTLLASAGSAGLGLAGYFSYSPKEESRRDMFIHKIGSFTGAVCLMLFHVIALHQYWALIALALGVVLGFILNGYRYISQYTREKGNSVVFWTEIAIIIVVSVTIVTQAIKMF